MIFLGVYVSGALVVSLVTRGTPLAKFAFVVLRSCCMFLVPHSTISSRAFYCLKCRHYVSLINHYSHCCSIPIQACTPAAPPCGYCGSTHPDCFQTHWSTSATTTPGGRSCHQTEPGSASVGSGSSQCS